MKQVIIIIAKTKVSRADARNVKIIPSVLRFMIETACFPFVVNAVFAHYRRGLRKFWRGKVKN